MRTKEGEDPYWWLGGTNTYPCLSLFGMNSTAQNSSGPMISHLPSLAPVLARSKQTDVRDFVAGHPLSLSLSCICLWQQFSASARKWLKRVSQSQQLPMCVSLPLALPHAAGCACEALKIRESSMGRLSRELHLRVADEGGAALQP